MASHIKVEHDINTDDYSVEKLADIIKQIKVLEGLIKQTRDKEAKKEAHKKLMDSDFWR